MPRDGWLSSSVPGTWAESDRQLAGVSGISDSRSRCRGSCPPPLAVRPSRRQAIPFEFRPFCVVDSCVSRRRLSGERLPIQTARGPGRDPEAVKRTILEEPEVVEKGLFALDAHLRAGNGGLIDLLAVDGSGALVILEIDRAGEDDLLRRALEHRGWVGSQVHFLRKLYGPERVHPFREPRAVLLGKRFSAAFLSKVAQLPVPLTPLLYRLVRIAGRTSIRLEAPPPVAPMERALPEVPAIPAAIPADVPAPADSDAPAAERLTHEEMEAFYHFERQRLQQEKEGAGGG